MVDSDWHEKVLRFWFEELTPKQWYVSTKTIDGTIQQRFESLITALANTAPSSHSLDAHRVLAATIVLDQFPRNIHRGSAQAFAYDHNALAVARYSIDNQLDAGLNNSERQFSYMPFMHSENLENQNTSVSLFTELDNKAGLDSALEHRDIIAQFGRFPHRNDVLNRRSTPEEIDYLATAKRFGQ